MNSLGTYCIIAGVVIGALFAVQMFRSAQRQSNDYKKISAAEAKEMFDTGNALIVDVRTEQEYAEAHIDGAVLIPHDKIAELAPEMLPDKSQTLLLHCRTGVRSAEAAGALVELGYRSVYDFGGIVDWPYETVK